MPLPPEAEAESTVRLHVADATDLAGPPPPDVTLGPRRSRRREDVRRPAAARRPGAVIGVAAAVVAVVGTAALASGLFDTDGSADRLAPDPNLTAPPWPSATAPPTATTTDAPSQPPSPSSSPSSSAPASASASESREPAATTPAPPGQQPTRTFKSEPLTANGPTLTRGDRGQPVSDLQHRLRELGLYSGPMHGRYDKNVEQSVATYQADRSITGDPRGTYGTTTRASLESETVGR
ncbi:peptidoglycan-binding domain-containing protein [Streptomyces sp. TRM49041]|uniref:peptidoglycan-binding domain-containing protein n=1 Tax=Streptomyces sp. TRM49041 TaxID=2603216 RepID=UPI001CA43A66|nr:peptidoglycan-binding domain-containing protein [Streptomyces sp. TRM49041]